MPIIIVYVNTFLINEYDIYKRKMAPLTLLFPTTPVPEPVCCSGGEMKREDVFLYINWIAPAVFFVRKNEHFHPVYALSF